MRPECPRRRHLHAAAALQYAIPMAIWLFVTSAAQLGAQQASDSSQHQDTTKRDSIAVRLAPVEVQASIAPAASSSIGSSVPARISIVTSREIDAWKPRTAADLLSAQTGVSLYDDLGSPYKLNLSTRGF